MFHPAVATYNPSKIEILKEHFKTLEPFINEAPQPNDEKKSAPPNAPDDQLEIYQGWN